MTNLPRDGVWTYGGLNADFRFVRTSREDPHYSIVETAAGTGCAPDSDLTYDPVRDLPPVPWNQPLFDHMSQNYNLTLLESEMHEIMLAVDRCRLNIWKAGQPSDLSPEAAAVVAKEKP